MLTKTNTKTVKDMGLCMPSTITILEMINIFNMTSFHCNAISFSQGVQLEIAYVYVGWISPQQRLPVTSACCATHFIDQEGRRAESSLTGFEPRIFRSNAQRYTD